MGAVLHVSVSSRLHAVLWPVLVTASVACCALSSFCKVSLCPLLIFCILWTILYIDFCLGPGCAMKAFCELEVTMVIGLCCEESDTRLITSTVSELIHNSRSVLIREDFCLGCCCLRLACSSFVCANAACFDFMSICEGFCMFFPFDGLLFLFGPFVLAFR